MIAALLSGVGARVVAIGAAILGVLAVLFGVRQSGRNAAKIEQAAKNAEVRDAQLKALADSPRDRAGVQRRLRDGTF